jgi:hypothetical protein
MQRSVTETQLVFVILLVAVIAFATLARRVQKPYPIVLVVEHELDLTEARLCDSRPGAD